MASMSMAEMHDALKRAHNAAKNAREAFEALAKSQFAAVLMDIQLMGSDLSGIEITQIVKGLYGGTEPTYARAIRLPELPIIFVTAYSARYSKEELVAAGGEDLVTKPVNFTGLTLALTRVITRRVTSKL